MTAHNEIGELLLRHSGSEREERQTNVRLVLATAKEN